GIALTDRPENLRIEQMETCAGWLSPPVASGAFAGAFPHASAALHPRRLSGLAQTSRLVGMVCPGLHSMYARLSVDLTQELGAPDGICFRTIRVDDQFRLVEMAVEGNGLVGEIASFVRHSPIEAPKMDEIARHVRPDEFATTAALVAGGSRGLGAIIAKLIAAGGGHVIV